MYTLSCFLGQAKCSRTSAHILCTGSLVMRAKCKATRWIRRSGAFCCFASPELRPKNGAFYNDNDYCSDCAVDIVLAIIRERSLGILFWVDSNATPIRMRIFLPLPLGTELVVQSAWKSPHNYFRNC